MVNTYVLGNPVNNRSGGKNVYFTETITCTIQGTVPFGVQEYKNNKTCDVQVSNPEFFENIDNFIIEKAKQNSFKWFNKSIHASVIKELYKSPLRKNKNYPPLLKVKLDLKKIQDTGIITKGSTVKFDVRNTGVYFSSGSFGSGWITDNVIVTHSVPKSVKLEGYSFIDDE